MDYQGLLLLIKLLTAHVLTDFVLQPTAWVHHKKIHRHRSPYLYWHVLIAAAVPYLMIMQWTNWQIPLVILVTHYAIDLWKLNKKDTIFYFFADQFLHIAVLIALWVCTGNNGEQFRQWLIPVLNNYKAWLVLLGFIFVIFPSQYILIYSTKKWSESFDHATEINALKDAGKWIGIFERTLILLSMLSGQYEAIGFLIAAKSFIRFSEKERKTRAQTEYILIGTLISFTIAILCGALIRVLLGAH